MTTLNAVKDSNRLIDALPSDEREKLLESSELVHLEFGVIIAKPDECMTEVFFPVSGYVSQVFTLGQHEPLEMSIIGNEGLLGSSLVLGLCNNPMQAVVRGAGSCHTINRKHFQVLLSDCPNLLKTIQRYHFVSEIQLAKNAACIHFHDIEQRLSRWLLMILDRAQTDQFHLTHSFLAGMLGVRRSGVTIAAGSLQSKLLISYTRGEILVLDREGLEAHACDCYKASLADYAHYFQA